MSYQPWSAPAPPPCSWGPRPAPVTIATRPASILGGGHHDGGPCVRSGVSGFLAARAPTRNMANAYGYFFQNKGLGHIYA
jgi:hypothetical protein